MSDDNLTPELDREIRADDKIERIEGSEIFQNATEITVALENNSPCRSLDSHKATLPGGIQTIFNEAMISGDDESDVDDNCDLVSHDVESGQADLVSVMQSVPRRALMNNTDGVAVTLEHADDITMQRTAEIYNGVRLLEAVGDYEVDEDTKSTLEIVSILAPSPQDSDIPSEEIMHNVTTAAIAGADTYVPLKLATPESTDSTTVEISLEVTITTEANADTIVRLGLPDLGSTVTSAAQNNGDTLSVNDVEVLMTTPAAGPAALILPGKGALGVTTVALDEESIDVDLPMNIAQTVVSVIEGDKNLPVKDAYITDSAKIVTANDVENKVEVIVVARSEGYCDRAESSAVCVSESRAEIPTAVTHDTVLTTVYSELSLITVAPIALSAEQTDLAAEIEIEVEATDVSQGDDCSILQGSINTAPVVCNLPTCNLRSLLSTCSDADNSGEQSETTACTSSMDKEVFDEAVLPEVCVPDTEAILPVELLSTTQNAPADKSEHSLEVKCSDSLGMESSEAAIISASPSEPMEQLQLIPLDDNVQSDILSADMICPSIETFENCDVLLSVSEGEDCESDIVHEIGDDVSVHSADKMIIADTVDAFEGENLTPFLQDQSSLSRCAGESRDCESFQNDDLLKVNTFARRLDYLKSVDKLNSPKRIHDDDVLDGEAVNEIVVIKESVVVTENIFIQENVFIKESIVIKECITMETTKAMYRPASLVKSDKTISLSSESILDNVILNDETVLLEPNAAIIEGPISFQFPTLIDDVTAADFKEPGNELEDGENETLGDHVEEEVPEAGKCVKSKVSLFTRLFGKKEIPPVEKTFVPTCCSGVLGGSTCYSTSAEDKVAIKCDKNTDKATVDMMTTEDSDEGFLDTV
jgi:hypothetical protein